MTQEVLLQAIALLGEPTICLPGLPDPPVSVQFIATASGQFGSFQYYTVPVTKEYTLVAQGAAGSLGSYQRSSSAEFPSTPGHAAIVTTQVNLTEGDELLIVVGQEGTNTRTVTTDGVGGGAGGGTFVFRKISSITDSRYQLTIAGQAYECLLVAAGGGGTQDNAYRQSTANGYDAATDLYSLSNFIAFSTTTGSPTSSGSTSSPMGLSQIATYEGAGKYYTRNSNFGYGGFGCGGVQDDNYSYGGGWSTSSTNYRTASWAMNGGSIAIATDLTAGSLSITAPGIAADNYFAWWPPVFDRVAADCVYGNPKGCIDSALLLRLEGNAEFLHKLFNDAWLIGNDEVVPSGVAWSREMYLYYAKMERIWRNIKNIHDVGYLRADTPPATAIAADAGITYTVINNWEKIMFDAYNVFRDVKNSKLILGTFYAGPNRQLQAIRR